jgi:hypothetical protein
MANREPGIDIVNVSYSGGTTAIYLNTAVSIWTDSIYVGDCTNEGYPFSPLVIGATFVGGVQGSVAAIVFAEGSWRRPSVEGSFDATYVSYSYNTLGISAVRTWAYTALNTAAAAVMLPYIRFMVRGTTTNTGSTVNVVLCKKMGV